MHAWQSWGNKQLLFIKMLFLLADGLPDFSGSLEKHLNGFVFTIIDCSLSTNKLLPSYQG